MTKILITTCPDANSKNILEQELPEGFSLFILSEITKEELLTKVADIEYLLVSGRLPIDKDVLLTANNLKMVQRTGVGIEMIDLEVLKSKKIPLYVNRSINSYCVAEHTILLILSALRQLPLADSSTKSGKWVRHELAMHNYELRNCTVGLIGLGSIGTRVAELLKPFNVSIIYYKRNKLDSEEEKMLGVSYKTLAELLDESDIISLHCPLTKETKNIIGRQEISKLRKGAIVINTSRGGLIDEKALALYLKSGHIKAAGLDVFSEEPLNTDNPLLKLDNVTLTPHIAGITSQSYREMIKEAFNNIKLFSQGNIDLIMAEELCLTLQDDKQEETR